MHTLGFMAVSPMAMCYKEQRRDLKQIPCLIGYR